MLKILNLHHAKDLKDLKDLVFAACSWTGWAAPSGTKQGVKLEHFPPGIASAPFTCVDAMTDKKHRMEFFGGMTCLVQHENGAIEPKVGWAVMDSGHLL